MTFEKIKEMFKKSIDTTDTMNQAIENLIQSIYLKGYNDALLSVNLQKPKIGKWIDEGFYAEGHSEHAYRCSECDEHYIGYVGEFKHCPNCGARMVEPTGKEQMNETDR